MTDTPYIEPLAESESSRLQELAQEAGVELPESGLDATQARRLLAELEERESQDSDGAT